MAQLGDENAVYRLVRRTSEELDKSYITAELQVAERMIKAETTRNYIADVLYAKFSRQTGSAIQTYETYFDIDQGTNPKVYVNDVLKTLNTDYTFADSVVTFTGTTINSGDVITIYYKPDFFDDYANFIAAQRIIGGSLVDTNNAVAMGQVEFISDQIKFYRKLIASKPYVARARDHKNAYGIF